MKEDLAFISDEEYEDVIREWELHYGVSTADLMAQYHEHEIEAINKYAGEAGILNLVEFYYFDDLVDELRERISRDLDYQATCTCDNFEWAVDRFIEALEMEILDEHATYFLVVPEPGTYHLRVDCHGEFVYWNLEQIWEYWTGLNKQNYFEQ